MEQNCLPDIDLEIYLKRKNIITNYFFTILICTAIAIVMTLSNPNNTFLVSFIMSQSFGLTISSTVMFVLLIFKPRRWFTLLLVIFISVSCSAIIGLNIALIILKEIFSININLPPKHFIKIILTAMIFTAAISYSFISKAKLRHRNEMIEEERNKRIAVEKESLSANLRMLQAQIEPHFLFNTLSNILSLIDTQPAKGKSMLLDLTKYLRTSLSRTLPEKTTLDQEIEMIKAYLNIQKIRMDERLNFIIDVPENLRQQSFPPMLLQPLVENAIKHGLEPKVEGGHPLKGTCQEKIISALQ